MRRSHVCCGVGGLIACLGVVAACRAYSGDGVPTANNWAAPAAIPKSSDVNDLLDKLESLKARRQAIAEEEKKTLALLKKKLKSQQARLGKLGIAHSPLVAPETLAPVSEPAPTSQTRYFYEPVTTYRRSRVYDPGTDSYESVTTPITTYVLRKVITPVVYPLRSPETAPSPSPSAAVPPVIVLPPAETNSRIVPVAPPPPPPATPETGDPPVPVAPAAPLIPAAPTSVIPS